MTGSTRRFMLAFAFVVLTTLATTPPAPAQAPEAPIVVTRSFAPLPPGWAFAVEPRDDSDDNLRLQAVFVEAFSAQHLLAVPGGPLRLRFTTDRVIPTDREQPTVPGVDDRLPRVGDDLPGSLLLDPIGTASRRERRFGTVTYRLRASVETRGGRVLWQGEAAASAARTGEKVIGPELVIALITELVRTVDPKVLGGIGGP